MMSKWFLILASIGLLSACSNSQPVAISVNSEYQQVQYGVSSMESKFKIVDISTEAMNDRVRGSVRLKSLTHDDEHVQYRFYWYDDKGVEVSVHEAAWKRLIIHGEDEVSLSEVSLSPKGENFRLQIRELN